MTLCQLLGNFAGEVWPDGALTFEKLNGWRALHFTGRDGTRRLWSRQGMPLEGVGHIVHRLRQMERAAGERMMFDGELIVGGPVGDTLARTKAWCESGWKKGGEAGRLHVFDCLTQAEWEAGGTDRPLVERQAMLADLVATTADEWDWRPGARGPDDPTAVQMVPCLGRMGTLGIVEEAQAIWARGGEGVVVKAPNSPYRRHRSKDWLKLRQDTPWYVKQARCAA